MTATAAPPPVTVDVGIVGAGRFGLALARAALRAGLSVAVASTRHPAALQRELDRDAPGATASTVALVAGGAVIAVLAIPLGRLHSLDPQLFSGRVLVDATNYAPLWDNRLLPEVSAAASSSELVRDLLPGARVVKALNHLGADELDDDSAAPGDPARRALAVAGDDDDAVRLALALVERLGFDAVDAGPLAVGKRLEPSSHVFNGWYTRAQLEAMFDSPRRSPAPWPLPR